MICLPDDNHEEEEEDEEDEEEKEEEEEQVKPKQEDEKEEEEEVAMKRKKKRKTKKKEEEETEEEEKANEDSHLAVSLENLPALSASLSFSWISLSSACLPPCGAVVACHSADEFLLRSPTRLTGFLSKQEQQLLKQSTSGINTRLPSCRLPYMITTEMYFFTAVSS